MFRLLLFVIVVAPMVVVSMMFIRTKITAARRRRVEQARRIDELEAENLRIDGIMARMKRRERSLDG